MTRVVVFMENDTELSIDGSPLSAEDLAARVSESLSAPGSVLTFHANNATHVIPVRAVRYVRIDPEDPS